MACWSTRRLSHLDCREPGHLPQVCPFSGRCLRCKQPGHRARDCKQAWGPSHSGPPVPVPAPQVPVSVPASIVPVSTSAAPVSSVPVSVPKSTVAPVSSVPVSVPKSTVAPVSSVPVSVPKSTVAPVSSVSPVSAPIPSPVSSKDNLSDFVRMCRLSRPLIKPSHYESEAVKIIRKVIKDHNLSVSDREIRRFLNTVHCR